MKRRLLMCIISICFINLVACGQEDKDGNSSSSNDELLEMIDVKIQTDPSLDKLKPNEEFTVSAKVTQNDENVNDADEVQFEFWKKEQAPDDHEMLEGEFQSDGVYSIKKTVEEPGIYYVISHVTARGMHNMPQQELVIGDADDLTDGNNNDQESESNEQEEHVSSGVEMHIMVDSELELEEEIALVAHIQEDGQPITEAKVQFELWKEGEEQREYIPAEEGSNGEYSADYRFEEAGKYTLKLHFKKDDLHDHIEKILTVN